MERKYNYYKFHDGFYFRTDYNNNTFQRLENKKWKTDEALISLFFENLTDYFEIQDKDTINELENFPNDNEKIIQEIFDQIVPFVLKDIPLEYIDEVKKGFYNYLTIKYAFKDFEENKLETIKLVIKLEQMEWERASNVYKLRLFVKDNSYEKICNLSLEAFEQAQKKNNNLVNVLSSLEAETKINELTNGLSHVCFFNYDLAKELISEGILDYLYASRDTDVMSLRLSHAKKQK